jgi:hypothetical protein
MVNRIEHLFEADEHHRTRERVRGLRELSPEQASYNAERAIREGRMSEYRDQLDYEDNMSCQDVATFTLGVAGLAFVVSMVAVAMLIR